MTQFAKNTNVPIEKTEAEIRGLLLRYGATAFASGWNGNRALVQFEFRKRTVQIEMALPEQTAKAFTMGRYRARSEDAARKLWQQACRQKWRALLLVLKAKLEAVQSGICTMEHEFLPWTVLPNGRTLAQELEPQMRAWIEDGRMPRLLAAPEGA